MHSVPAKQARIEFTHILDDVAFKGERYIVTRNGRDLVAVIPVADLEILQKLENKRDLEAAKKAEKYILEHGTDSWDTLEKQLGIDGE